MSSPVVLITGASAGIGRATAALLVQHGFTVFGTSREPEKVKDVNFSLLPLDVRQDESAAACIQTVIERAGKLDILINNAGYSMSGAVEEASVAEAKALFDTNFFGMMRMVNAALPVMRSQGSGRIVNVSSLAGILGVPYIGLYTATKFAVEGYSESLRHEVRQFGIHVSLVEPGDIRTNIVVQPPARSIRDYDGVRERVNSLHEANVRNGPSPEIVAQTILRVVTASSPRLRYVAGKEWYVLLGKRLLPAGIMEWLVQRTYKMD